jgi:FkbM family methyltransferase
MNQKLAKLVRNAINRIGWDIHRHRPVPPLISHPYFSVLLDIGANTGQYALQARSDGFKGKIISIEPSSTAHQRLSENASRDSMWIVHERIAVTASAGFIEMNVSENSQSSSTKEILTSHLEAAPNSRYIARETVPTLPLDDVYELYCTANDSVYVKIDTQGNEYEVLAGGRRCLEMAAAVEIELSTEPLYQDQRLFDFFIDKFQGEGFDLWDIRPVFYNVKSGKLLQFDAIFCNKRFFSDRK